VLNYLSPFSGKVSGVDICHGKKIRVYSVLYFYQSVVCICYKMFFEYCQGTGDNKDSQTAVTLCDC
jgi:hypothetical protein